MMRSLFSAVLSLCFLFFTGFVLLPHISLAADLPSPDYGPAAGTAYIGYSWPFPDEDITKRFGPSPVLVEYFSDPGCVFCGVGDEFANDLIRKTNLIVLACHVNRLRSGLSNPLLLADCAERQTNHTIVKRWRVQVPQFIINGTYRTDGLNPQNVIDQIDTASHEKSLYLSAKRIDDQGTERRYVVDLPAETLGEVEGFNDRVHVKLIEYRKPMTVTASDGPYAGWTAQHYHVVNRIVALDDWDGTAGPYHITWVPSEDAEGAVVSFQRQDHGILWFTELKR